MNISEKTEEMLENIDLSGIEGFFSRSEYGENFMSKVKDILSGDFNTDYESFFSYLLNVLFSNVKSFLPAFVSMLALSVFSVLLSGVNGGTKNVISTICFFAVGTVLTVQAAIVFEKTKETLNGFSDFVSVVSPVLITLMITGGGTVSAAMYKPAVAFLTNGIIGIILSVVIPLITVSFVLTVLSSFTDSVKFSKFTEFIFSVIK